jgi:hypothetical protein
MQYKVCALEKDKASFPGECFYRFETEKARDCNIDPNNGLLIDTRYVAAGLSVSEFELEQRNGVLG